MIALVTPESLGTRIRRGRQRHRWTQDEFAQRVGVSPRTVGDWERGVKMPRNLTIIEDILGVSLEDSEPELDYDRDDEAERGIGEDPSLSLQQKRYLLGQIRSARQEPSERARKRPA